ncbi:IS5 family transposase, partial [Vibrio sp.]|uniref:IS5 family transposase n=1 Tax=Vibrio sp. TaxID=678 RepID=UPI003D0B8CC7
LDDFETIIDWSVIEHQLSRIHSNPMGEKAWPPIMMFKVLLLQSWYNLSDPACEKQLARDLLFRRFARLNIDDGVPDHSTIWRFRTKLQKEGHLQPLLDLINDQLHAQGVLIKTGQATIIDASVIEAKNNRPNKNARGENTQDKDASYNVKTASDGKQKTTYGFKAHINVDEDGLIRSEQLSTGKLHDSNVFESLLTGTEKAAYADSAYKSEKHDKLLAQRGVSNRILHRAYRNKPLTDEQKQFNRHASEVRCTVERVFGILKRLYGLGKARYLGLERNQARLSLIAMAYNLKRGVNIQRACR